MSIICIRTNNCHCTSQFTERKRKSLILQSHKSYLFQFLSLVLLFSFFFFFLFLFLYLSFSLFLFNFYLCTITCCHYWLSVLTLISPPKKSEHITTNKKGRYILDHSALHNIAFGPWAWNKYLNLIVSFAILTLISLQSP